MIKTHADRLAALRLLGVASGYAASWWSDRDLERALTNGIRVPSSWSPQSLSVMPCDIMKAGEFEMGPLRAAQEAQREISIGRGEWRAHRC